MAFGGVREKHHGAMSAWPSANILGVQDTVFPGSDSILPISPGGGQGLVLL